MNHTPKTIKEVVKSGSFTVVDVRSVVEFRGGSVANAVNIPINELESRIDEVKALKKPLLLCCASGGRSGLAQQKLHAAGVQCYNGGSWLQVNYLIAQI